MAIKEAPQAFSPHDPRQRSVVPAVGCLMTSLSSKSHCHTAALPCRSGIILKEHGVA